MQQIILQGVLSHQCLNALPRKLLHHAPRAIHEASESIAAK